MALQQSGLRTKVLMNKLAKLKLSREECGKTTLPTTWGQVSLGHCIIRCASSIVRHAAHLLLSLLTSVILCSTFDVLQLEDVLVD